MSNCVVTSGRMQSIEKKFIEDSGVDIQDLMDKAGYALSELIKAKINKDNIKLTGRAYRPSKQVLFLCGKGNNGGDGIAAARFMGESYNNNVVIFSDEENISSASKKALDKYGQAVIFLPDINKIKELISKADVIVDCLFGFNFKGSIKGNLAKVVNLVNESEKTVISADIPSGVDVTTGKTEGPAIKANQTLAFSCAKFGHFLPPGSFARGELKVADIGIPIKKNEVNAFFTDIETAKNLLPERNPRMHKKTAGSVLIIAGSKQYTGAAAMAVSSAVLRAGAGYVTVAVPDVISGIIQEKVTEPIVKSMPSVNGSLSLKALDELIDLADKNTVTLIGPGISSEPETLDLAAKFIKECDKPVIIDADAVNAVTLLKSSHLITPHSGEFARLTGKSIKEVEEARFKEVYEYSQKNKTNVLLKGPNTIITNGKITYFNTTGNSGLATAGTGDILGGLIAGLASQGLSLFEAAVLGAYVHGLAADLAVEELTRYSLIATDLLCWIPMAIKHIQTHGNK